MASQKRGQHSFEPSSPPVIAAWASVAGKREAEGPLGAWFHRTWDDNYLGQATWEQAECKLQQTALELLMERSGMEEPELVLSGDLLNQCISSSFALRNRGIPALGLYGACSTMAQSLLMGTMALSGGFVNHGVCMTSSHFAASERQYRFPLNYGGQRPPTAQWTATGAGAALLKATGDSTLPRIDGATIGTIHDLGVTDANQMGAAMAPAAFDTMDQHFRDLKRSPLDYDLIVTGDLGSIGGELVRYLFRQKGVHLDERYTDCGILLFDPQHQDVHAGGSGCGCSAIVLCGYLLEGMKTGRWKRLLFCGTGALLSPTSVQQNRSIPGICHAVSISCQ